jgi:hypothetical protein
VGIELFSIGLCRAQVFHIIQGILSYEFSNDFIDYSDIAIYVKFLIDYDYEYKLDSYVIESNEEK